ncbi:hypothetical protein SAMN05878443_0063 [Carnobacterium alterfunditum]|uniref:Uncharacterized protein n=1 Tax=Carnobacterium alterfunditum TaxID=28230 RepID=A0A1N6ELE2_9LACT|nr:hypothetical protein SAMN05878443_0063 [Carnobacterium alterfunditum]
MIMYQGNLGSLKKRIEIKRSLFPKKGIVNNVLNYNPKTSISFLDCFLSVFFLTYTAKKYIVLL